MPAGAPSGVNRRRQRAGLLGEGGSVLGWPLSHALVGLDGAKAMVDRSFSSVASTLSISFS